MRLVVVGEPEQVVGAQARLHVLERHVVGGLAVREGMLEIGQHLAGGRPDVELLRRDAERRHQRPGVALGFGAGGEARHGEAEDVGARQLRAGPSPWRRRSARAVESRPPETPMTMRVVLMARAAAAGPRPGCCRPRSSPARAGPGRPARRGNARCAARSRCRRPADRGGTTTVRNEPGSNAQVAAVVVERALARALLPQQVEVDIRDGDLVAPRGIGRFRPA